MQICPPCFMKRQGRDALGRFYHMVKGENRNESFGSALYECGFCDYQSGINEILEHVKKHLPKK